MKTICKNVYLFDELKDDQKSKAIERNSDINVAYEWYNSLSDDANEIGLKITGFDIGRGEYCTGEFNLSPCEVANKIIANHGENCETYKTAKEFLNDYGQLVAKYSDGKNLEIVSEDNEWDFDNEADDIENEFLKSLLGDYLIMLRNEYEYMTSEEAIKETLTINEYYFDENGNIC